MKSSICVNIGLLLLAIISMMIVAVPAFFIQVLRYAYFKKRSLNEYFYKLALSIDYLGAALLFGTVGRTISALTYQKEIKWGIRFIDWIFYPGHCREEYEHEVKNKYKTIYQDEYGV